jgi:hypothetical protein
MPKPTVRPILASPSPNKTVCVGTGSKPVKKGSRIRNGKMQYFCKHCGKYVGSRNGGLNPHQGRKPYSVCAECESAVWDTHYLCESCR